MKKAIPLFVYLFLASCDKSPDSPAPFDSAVLEGAWELQSTDLNMWFIAGYPVLDSAKSFQPVSQVSEGCYNRLFRLAYAITDSSPARFFLAFSGTNLTRTALRDVDTGGKAYEIDQFTCSFQSGNMQTSPCQGYMDMCDFGDLSASTQVRGDTLLVTYQYVVQSRPIPGCVDDFPPVKFREVERYARRDSVPSVASRVEQINGDNDVFMGLMTYEVTGGILGMCCGL